MPIQLIADANPGNADWSTTVATHVPVALGSIEIANGVATGTAAVGVAFNAFPVIATLNEVDGVVSVVAAVVAAGTLTVTLSANTTGIRTCGYVILGALA